MGATAEPVAEFIARLREADGVLLAARDRLVAASVHDAAFGKLFEARAVHDAYHQRLPETGRNFDEARAVLAHFITGLAGGHHIARVKP
ncbi:MAG TPA: hypothetical protein VJT31_35900 [Rugosimonospora sp.]|nr:hypothetical protein [Rugosimonospora sp.]